MIKRRKSLANASSLDLFLDTICNAFGGIMFLSILISILAQSKSESTPTKSEEPVISEVRAQEIEEELESLQTKRTKLVSAILKIEQERVGEDHVKMRELLKKIEEVTAKLEKAVEQQSEKSRLLSAMLKEISKKEQESVELEREISKARAAFLEKSTALDDALDASIQNVALPKVKASDHSNIPLAMRNEKLYLVIDRSVQGNAPFYTQHVDSYNKDGVSRFRPKATAGWDLANDSARKEFESIVANFPPSKNFVSIAVWSDSYESFGIAKELLLRLGYEYELVPVGDVDDMAVGIGDSPIVQ